MQENKSPAFHLNSASISTYLKYAYPNIFFSCFLAALLTLALAIFISPLLWSVDPWKTEHLNALFPMFGIIFVVCIVYFLSRLRIRKDPTEYLRERYRLIPRVGIGISIPLAFRTQETREDAELEEGPDDKNKSIGQSIAMIAKSMKYALFGGDNITEGKSIEDETVSSMGIKMSLPKLKVKRRKRAFLVGKRGIAITSIARGRYRYYEIPRGSSFDIALIPTVQAAAMHGHVSREGVPLVRVQPSDFRTKVREYRAPVTLVLVIDVSESMKPWLPILASTISMINQDAYRKRDRVGVIAFKKDTAYILNHPTSNVNIVAGNIRRLGASGTTPLADGLLKALEMIKQDKRKNRDVLPMVVLISDCEANIPLSIKARVGENVVQACNDTISVAFLMAQSHIPLIVMNPCHIKNDAMSIYQSGTALALEVAKITNGRYYGFTPLPGLVFPDDKLPPSILKPRDILEMLVESKSDMPFLKTGESPISVVY